MPSTPFALGTFANEHGIVFAGLVVEDEVVDLARVFGRAVSVRSLLEDWDGASRQLQALADDLPAGRQSASDLRTLAPVQPPGQIFQSGANYRKHVLDLLAAAELRGDDSDGLASEARDHARAQLDQRAHSGRPFVFTGSAHAMVGPYDDVALPFDSVKHDWELELVAVIGRAARRISREEAVGIVAGYTICNDITTRDALNRADASSLGLDWLAGKNAPTFLPTGPYLVPAIHAGDPMNLQITLRVNGEVMQQESTHDMLFDVAAIIEHISNVAALRPSELVLTGSPAGNGASHGVFLRAGDVMEGEITGLGTQRNLCIDEPARVTA